MKNPYLFGYLPLITIILFSLSFGVWSVSEALQLFMKIGVYSGMREFLTDVQLRMFLLVLFGLAFFMLFSALKLIAETIQEIGLLFFSKQIENGVIPEARGGYVIFFFGALASIVGIQSIVVLLAIFSVTVLVYFIYVSYKISFHLTAVGTIGVILFEIASWCLFSSSIIYILYRLYNGLMASLPL